jgi:hypothetical protein
MMIGERLGGGAEYQSAISAFLNGLDNTGVNRVYNCILCGSRYMCQQVLYLLNTIYRKISNV